MANFDTGQDLLAYFLRRCGELFPSHTTANLSLADRLIDAKLHLTTGYWDLCALKPWRWARKDPPAQFVSIAKQAVTVSSISGSTVTLSATIAASQAGRKVFVDADGIPCRISAHGAGTAVLTLATTYPGDTTAGAATIFMDELTVATDILAYPDVRDLSVARTPALIMVTETEFRSLFPLNTSEGAGSRYATFITDSKVRIGPWPTDVHLFECSYNYRPSVLTFDGAAATDTPICPTNVRELVALLALRRLLTDKRAQALMGGIDAEITTRLSVLGGADGSFQKPRAFVPAGYRAMA